MKKEQFSEMREKNSREDSQKRGDFPEISHCLSDNLPATLFDAFDHVIALEGAKPSKYVSLTLPAEIP